MRLKEKAKIKDDIIRYLIKVQQDRIENISKKLGIDYDITHSLIQDLIFKDLLTLRGKIASKESFFNDDMMVLINPKGRYFLNQEGGFINDHKRYKQQQNWTIVKISTATANAIIIVCISIWGITKANNVSHLERQVTIFDSIMTNQNLKIIELENIVFHLKNDTIKN